MLADDFDDDGRWPATVRVLRRTIDEARRVGNRSTMPPTRDAGSPLAMACYAGRSVADLRRAEPAADVLRDLVSLL